MISLLISNLLSDYVFYVLGSLTISFILYQLRIHKMLSSLQTQQDKLEVILFGSEMDSTDQGFVPETKNELTNINSEIQDINKNIQQTNKQLEEINRELKTQEENNNSNNK